MVESLRDGKQIPLLNIVKTQQPVFPAPYTQAEEVTMKIKIILF